MYLVTLKSKFEETPLDLCKDLFIAKGRKYDYKIGWRDLNPIKIYKITLEELEDDNQ